MDTVEELELSLKEIAKWEAFETRRTAVLARRKISQKLASDMQGMRRKEQRLEALPQRLAAIKAKQERLKEARKEKRLLKLPEKVAKYQTQCEVSNLKRRLRRLSNRIAAIPKDFRCPKCQHRKLMNRMWAVVDGVAICKGCHLGWKPSKQIETTPKQIKVDPKAVLRATIPKDYVCKGCGIIKIALKYWRIDSVDNSVICKTCLSAKMALTSK